MANKPVIPNYGDRYCNGEHAASLLLKAADILEMDEFMTVQFIRQVLSILKDEVIPSLIERDTAWGLIISPSTRTDG